MRIEALLLEHPVGQGGLGRWFVITDDRCRLVCHGKAPLGVNPALAREFQSRTAALGKTSPWSRFADERNKAYCVKQGNGLLAFASMRFAGSQIRRPLATPMVQPAGLRNAGTSQRKTRRAP